jgi:tetratricopeptide (TPR) repeat protein
MNELDTKGLWYIHQIMRNSLQEVQNNELIHETHTFLLEYYTSKINDEEVINNFGSSQKMALAEGIYHAKNVLPIEDLVEWFEKITQPFIMTSKYTFIAPLFKEVIDFIDEKESDNHPLLAKLVTKLSTILCSGKKYLHAKPTIMRAIELSTKAMGEIHPFVAENYLSLAEYTYKIDNDFEKTKSYYQKALEIQKQTIGEQHLDTAVTYTQWLSSLPLLETTTYLKSTIVKLILSENASSVTLIISYQLH